jgi:P4 family phage/plasmid primase-like protien
MSTPDLYQFLSQYKATKEEGYTHTSIGRPAGSYNIPVDKKDELIDCLYETIFVRKVAVHLTEKPPQETIIKADLDFKYQLEDSSRKYTIDQIKSIVDLYHKAIRHFLDVSDEELKAFVFERDAPYKDKGNSKDGVHIMYPYLICDTKIQHLIRDHVLQNCQTILSQLGCKNNFDDIVDKAVVSTNNWLMYGCSKMGPKPYKLTHIFDQEFNDLNIKKYDNKTLLKLLSIRDHDPVMFKPIKTEHKYLLEKQKNPTKIAKKTGISIQKMITNLSKNCTKYDISPSDVSELVRLLSKDRAEGYKSWIDVGLCLRNIAVGLGGSTDICQQLLHSWTRFSIASSKYKEGECESIWNNIEFRDDGLGLGSLFRWAKLDNPNGYIEYEKTALQSYILKSQSQTTQDVATVVFNRYRYDYKCTSLKHGTWYEFRNHRWFQIDCGVSLRKRIGNEVINEYLHLITRYNNNACEQHDDQKDQYLQKAKALTDVTYKLRDYGFKEKIMKECQTMFYDATFTSQLDANPDLIGFENGVYDLRNGEFRDGRPEDFISLTTGNDYIEYRDDDELIVAIFSFMTQVFPVQETREYVFQLLSSFLEGRNPNEKFHIWTGVGGNGKSKLLELFELAFGKYTAKIPVTVLTQKTKGTSNSANPEVARLKGSRAVSTQEPEENERFNVGIMKDWTGGDRITCRPLYGDPFDFKPQFKMVFCCNHLPSLPPDDDGTWRRISVVEFKARFVDTPDPNNPFEFKKDTHLTEKLYSWKEAFMYILLEYYKDYRKTGLQEPSAVKEATRDYQRLNDSYVDFIEDSIDKDHEGSVKLEDAFKRFKDWWKENLGGKAPSRKEMKASLEKKLGRYLSSAKGGWKGFVLRAVNEDKNDESNEIVINKGRINEELVEE